MIKTVKVPGSWADVTCLDLETVKVPAPPGFRMANGEPLRQRWSIAMAGVARDGAVYMIEGGPESERLWLLGVTLADSPEVRYAATRQFDEMICRGRFTNARRAHEPEPFFPAVPKADALPWRNLGRNLGVPIARGYDCDSRNVPALIASGTLPVVRVHLLRDVAELILTACPGPVAEAWCRRLLTDYSFALALVS
jgi:hypothetical protein